MFSGVTVTNKSSMPWLPYVPCTSNQSLSVIATAESDPWEGHSKLSLNDAHVETTFRTNISGDLRKEPYQTQRIDKGPTLKTPRLRRSSWFGSCVLSCKGEKCMGSLGGERGLLTIIVMGHFQDTQTSPQPSPEAYAKRDFDLECSPALHTRQLGKNPSFMYTQCTTASWYQSLIIDSIHSACPQRHWTSLEK